MNMGRLVMIMVAGSVPFAMQANPAADRDEIEPAPAAAPRAPAAEKARTPLAADEIARARVLVGELGKQEFGRRESAWRELLALGEKSPGEILGLLPADPADPEIAARCEAIREALTGPANETPSTAAAPGVRLGAPNRGPAPAAQPRGGGIQMRPAGAPAPAALNLQTLRVRVVEGEVRPEGAPENIDEKNVEKPAPDRKTPAPAGGLE